MRLSKNLSTSLKQSINNNNIIKPLNENAAPEDKYAISEQAQLAVW